MGRPFLAGYSPKEIARKQDYLNRIVFPAIGDPSLPEVTPRIVLERLLRPLEAQGKLVAAGKVKSLVGMIFRYGIASGQAGRDPARDLAGALRPPRTVHRAAILDPAAPGRFLNAAAGYEGTPPVAYALRILPYVFVRPGELRNAEWAGFDLGQAV
ncbi:MAG: hypothetical protein LBG06_03105 [Deltaproteobacteria bacterium]|nr:hypothetical protein [Deltaproteobacteria bacterium]